MRVHRLEIEALGPFADRVTIDVDALSAEGLFLIHGPTGSGKTSLLDAICFALYADVPGARSKRGLQSDHARPDAVPRVCLELTAGVRRLRITRSPEFERPKKRGTGTSKVQSQVSLEERVDGRWVPLSTRHDEVADVVKDALGMGMAQFAKVVLLPQGEFAAFLRSTPEDRREVLERLFDISAFSDVEAWLADARRTAGAHLEQARTELATTLSRVEDVLADVALPAPPRGADRVVAGEGTAPTAEGSGAAPAGSAPTLGEVPVDRIADHVAAVARVLDTRVTTTMAAFDAASGAERVAAESLAAGRAMADLRTRGIRALARLSELEAGGPAHEHRVAELAEAERAAALAGHLGAHDRAAADAAATQARADLTRGALGPGSLADTPDDDVDELLHRVRGLDTTAAALGHELELAAGRARRRAELEARLEQLEAAAAAQRRSLAAAEAERESLAAQVATVAARAGRVAELELLLSAARGQVDVLDAAEQDLARAQALAPRLTTLREVTLDRRTELLDLRQRRLDGMAAELARSLADGDPCPVCGGVEHPAPARVSDPVLPDDLAAAELRLDVAQSELRAADAEVESLTTRARTRLTTLGDGTSRESLEAAVADGLDRLEAARADAAQHCALSQRLESVTAAVQERHRDIAAAVARADSLVVLLDELDVADAGGAVRADELRALHAECPCGATGSAQHAEHRERSEAREPTTTFDHTRHARLSALLGHHAAAVTDLRAARARAHAARAELDAALATAGFIDLDAARSATLPDDEVARLRAQVTAHLEDAAATKAVVEDPDVAAALLAAPPDLPELQAAQRAARNALLAAAAAQDEAARALRGIERLLPLVRSASAAVAGAAAHDARVRDLADTTSGTGPDNTLRMRLTAYVLAARLEKVATLANERLVVLGGGRYVLEHSDERAARGARSGLGLRVLDQWTGRVRDTATLSGGESFMASLALALGLADAVREEAGGLDLGTLFIDEGFGSLDDDSLEQVLTVLDGLREGGRAVGVVSHVADLRTRISHQVVVHKGASGSSVEVRTGGRFDQPAA